MKARSKHNPFNLPSGEPIRREQVKVFRQERAAITRYTKTGQKDDYGTNLPANWPSWDDFGFGALEVSQRFTPLIAAYWKQGGRDLFSRVGLDPDEWSVTNPHTEEMIKKASLDLCVETQNTTSLQLDEALQKTREELIEGVIKKGESLDKLTQRVNAIFDGAEKWRARRIASTEASRAVHAANEQSAIESEVVTGWEWLLSGDACPLCHTIYRRAKFVKLHQPFAVIGDHPSYAEIRFPPGHPGCQCTVVEVLDTDRQPDWSDTLNQPKPEAEDKPEPEEKPKPKSTRPRPAPLPPKPSAKPTMPPPGTPFRPNDLIQDRIAAWTDGDERIKQLKGIDNSELASAIADTRRLVAEIMQYLDANGRPRQNLTSDENRKLIATGQQWQDATKRIKAERQKMVQVVSKVLAVPDSKNEGIRLGVRTKPPSQATLIDAANGFYQQAFRAGSQPVSINYKSTTGRANYRRDQETIRLAGRSHIGIVIHEQAHAIEHQCPEIEKRLREFLEYRCAGEKPVKIKDIAPGKGYDDSEEGRKDHFDRQFKEEAPYYVGKAYKYGTEVLSMGMQELVDDPAGFAKNDPEYVKFLVGIMSGELR